MPGYLAEIFSSFQGEGFAVEGSCYGKRQSFIRFAGCNFAKDSNPCIWCDSPSAQALKIENFKVKKTPGSANFIKLPNPADVELILNWIHEISSPDMHSISVTGGEPLYQIDFLYELAEKLSDFKLYLETNGSLPENAKRVVEFFDYCCCDIKDDTAIKSKDWKKIVDQEFQTIKYFVNAQKMIFAKVVVTSSTKIENIQWYASRLSELNVPLAIQIVSSKKNKESIPNFQHICKLTEAAAKYLSPDQIGISVQTHKFLGYL
ncbi:MAG: 7-carboxy-7-deazaguanine synthase QueE [Candidatus Helarchaeota archaeon]|nr:7-carboxy-7-deazaguanine synthase QueE [Candidatus Helarchaeota archaeon]